MPGRRGNNEGSITKRSDERWEARISLENGKRQSFYGKTRQEVARKLTEALRDRDRGIPVIAERQTVAQYLAAWLGTVEPTIGPTTLMRYEVVVRCHLVPTLGKIPIVKLTPQHIQALYTAKLNAGLASTTVHHIHELIHHALGDGMRLGVLQRNVADFVDPPRIRHHEMTVLTQEEARTFLEAARGHPFEALFVLALTTGMREGELLGLKWRDVDIEHGTLQVRGTLKRIKGKLFIAEPKTRRSRRRIALTPLACDALRCHQIAQEQHCKLLGDAWQEQGLVFPNQIGQPVHLCSFSRDKFKSLLKKAGVTSIRFHDLRHTAATLLLLRGVHVKVVSEMLGHSSVSITLDRYSHVLPDMQRDATAAMQSVLG